MVVGIHIIGNVSFDYPLASEILTPLDIDYIVASNITAFLSAAGSLVIIFTYMFMKEIRTNSRLLLVYLSVATIFVSISTLMQSATYYKNAYFPPEKKTLCQFASFWMVQSEITTALWSMAISFYLFLCVSCQCITIANRLFFLFHVFCWVMPFIVAVTADVSGVYGYDTTSMVFSKHTSACWISSRISNPLPWYLITVEGWVLAAFAVISLLYVPVTWTIMRNKNKGKEITGDDVIEELAIRTANEQLRFIPAIYMCIRLWGTVYFFLTRYPEPRHLRASDWLLVFKGIMENSQGLINALFFCLATKQVRHHIARRIRRCCGCFSTWCGHQKVIGRARWMRVSQIVRPGQQLSTRRSRALDGSDLDISGISLELPTVDADLGMGDEDTIFEQ